MNARRFWADDFDLDLLKVIPGVDDALGTSADIPLWTHGGTSHGRLNHPAVWHTGIGPTAFFGTAADQTGKPDSYYTGHPVVACTWREVVRDAWVHTYVVVVDGVPTWDAARFTRTFERLMYDVRGWQALPDGEADRLRGTVLASLVAATRQLNRHVEAVASR